MRFYPSNYPGLICHKRNGASYVGTSLSITKRGKLKSNKKRIAPTQTRFHPPVEISLIISFITIISDMRCSERTNLHPHQPPRARTRIGFSSQRGSSRIPPRFHCSAAAALCRRTTNNPPLLADRATSPLTVSPFSQIDTLPTPPRQASSRALFDPAM